MPCNLSSSPSTHPTTRRRLAGCGAAAGPGGLVHHCGRPVGCLPRPLPRPVRDLPGQRVGCVRRPRAVSLPTPGQLRWCAVVQHSENRAGAAVVWLVPVQAHVLTLPASSGPPLQLCLMRARSGQQARASCLIPMTSAGRPGRAAAAKPFSCLPPKRQHGELRGEQQTVAHCCACACYFPSPALCNHAAVSTEVAGWERVGAAAASMQRHRLKAAGPSGRFSPSFALNRCDRHVIAC